MGTVLAVDDHDFARRTARVIHAKFAHNAVALERFLEEAQVTAQLEHPNIVPIHDVGMTTDGTLYYTMKMIKGVSLGEVIKKLLKMITPQNTVDRRVYFTVVFESIRWPGLRA